MARGQTGGFPNSRHEREARAEGWRAVAGIDEAGRGPLAGPVVAAAVILPKKVRLQGLDDSKKLSRARREDLFAELRETRGIFWAIGMVQPEEIDRINILQATWRAMALAAGALAVKADFCLIDGLAVRNFPLPHRAIVKGDRASLSIAAASIVAKVSRDALMIEAGETFPDYGFASHKGYGTKAHLEALRIHGPCPLHRRSFQPVAQLTLPFDEAG